MQSPPQQTAEGEITALRKLPVKRDLGSSSLYVWMEYVHFQTCKYVKILHIFPSLDILELHYKKKFHGKEGQ